MARTTTAAVRLIIPTDADLSLDSFISAATCLVDYVAAQDTDSLVSTDLLTEIETWLAAHFYAIRDLQYHQKQTEKASAVFQGKTGMSLDATLWGQQAKVLDVSGTLGTLGRQKHVASMGWLGLPPSEQTDYEDRD